MTTTNVGSVSTNDFASEIGDYTTEEANEEENNDYIDHQTGNNNFLPFTTPNNRTTADLNQNYSQDADSTAASSYPHQEPQQNEKRPRRRKAANVARIQKESSLGASQEIFPWMKERRKNKTDKNKSPSVNTHCSRSISSDNGQPIEQAGHRSSFCSTEDGSEAHLSDEQGNFTSFIDFFSPIFHSRAPVGNVLSENFLCHATRLGIL